jgi:hypothetical protein
MAEAKPDVEHLKVRILEVLDREGKALIALNASLYAADTSDMLATVKVRPTRQACQSGDLDVRRSESHRGG